MRLGSLATSPTKIQGVNQCIDGLPGIFVGRSGQMGVSGGGQYATMTEDFLKLYKIYPGFKHVGGKTMP